MAAAGMAGKAKSKWNLRINWTLYAMLIPAAVFIIIFNYVPMYGVVIAFQDFQPAYGFWGSPFVGFKWFDTIFHIPDFSKILFNTVYISVLKLIFGQLAPILFALLINEIRVKWYKKTIQTFVYFPHFVSWVILSGIFTDLLSQKGLVNQAIGLFGIHSIYFLGDNHWFRFTLVVTDVWKGFGWGAILYLAAIMGINPELYESASLDGANRFKQVLHITLPGIMPTIILLAAMSLGSVMDAGFEQIFMLYNPIVYDTGDVIDTYVYRAGILDAQFSLGTAVGLFKSVIGFFLIILSYRLASKYANYRIF